MHEHAGHPDYKFTVVADYIVPNPEEIEDFNHEDHAVIYTDGYVVITIFEYCYAMWDADNGNFMGGSLWKKGEWKLNEASLKKIGEFIQYRNSSEKEKTRFNKKVIFL